MDAKGRRTSPPEAAAAHADPRRALGRRGEQLAAEHLRRRGCVELARNVRTRAGEIDLIVLDGRVLVFVEVKTRRVPRRRGAIREHEDPLHGIDPRQRQRIRRLAAAWLRDERHRRPRAQAIRFDAIGVVLDASGSPRRLVHIEDAF
jgi:putative endonuclease